MPDLRKTIQTLTESFAAAVAEEVATSINATIHEHSREFAEGVLEAIRGSSLSDIVAAGAGDKPVVQRPRRSSPPGRKHHKRTRTEIERLAKEIEGLCKKHPSGLKAEEMRAVLKVRPVELQRPISKLLASGRVTKTGQARATLYFAAA